MAEENKHDFENHLRTFSLLNLKLNKYPLLVTLCFFIAISYVSFFHHHYWFEYDGITLLHVGEQILSGDGKNVFLTGAAPGGPILYAALNSLAHNGFYVEKTIQLLGGTGIVFFSYFIIRNIFNSKIALLGQLFFAFNPRLEFLSTLSLDELLPVFLIFISLYFVTKKQLRLSNLILVGIFLGLSFMIRYQALFVLIPIIIFLLIRDKKIRTNLSFAVLTVIIFMITISPMMIYNYSTYGVITSSSPNLYLLALSKIQTPQWHEKMQSMVNESTLSGILFNFPLFLKNYFYNLFYYNPNNLFNFNKYDNLSIMPLVPFIGIIPTLGGLIYCLKIKLNKTNLAALLVSISFSLVFVSLLGDISVYFFTIIIIPLLVLGIINIKNIEKNLLPLLFLSVIFFLGLSILPLYRSYQLLPMWITIPTLSSVFFLEALSKIFSKIKKTFSKNNSQKIIIVLISLILFINMGFSYKLFEATFYGDTYGNITEEFLKLFKNYEIRQEAGNDYKVVGDILSKQPGIENSYVMTQNVAYAYYANSKFLYTDFSEGIQNDTVENFIDRKNWNSFEIWVSNVSTYPTDIHNLNKPIPDYLIYRPSKPDPTIWYVDTKQHTDWNLFSNPNNPAIPSNFKVLYSDNKTGTVAYKIYHDNNR